MATIKKAQNGNETNTPKKKNILGGSYVSPYSVKKTAKNIANKIGRGIQAVGDPAVSTLHRTGDLLKGAYEIQKKGTKEAFVNATKKNGGPIKKKMKNGGAVKNLSAGPSKKTKIAPKVDAKGAYTKVQERTLGNMKMGGKMKKGKSC